MKTKNMTTLQLRNSVNRLPLQHGFLLIPLVIVCLGLSPTARAVTPAPDGGYPGQNTAEGTTALFSLTTGFYNTAIGFEALYSNTSAPYNTAVGANALYSNTDGFDNVANGVFALYSNTTGIRNTANGVFALGGNTTGFDNTATGSFALSSNTGSNNTATGSSALYNNTTGNLNTATGQAALYNNTTGSDNTANGEAALFSNATGSGNTANGIDALYSNTTGSGNTATGDEALFSNTTSVQNTADGNDALYSNTTGIENTASGVNALSHNTTGNSNTADGANALQGNTTGNDNIAMGHLAGFNLTTGDNNINIGNEGVAAESNTIRIGTGGIHTVTFIAGIYNATVVKGVGVVVDSNGHLGTKGSSARFKDQIKPMDKASEAILALKPVTFHYKKALDPDATPQFGLVAEDVAKVNPDLVVRDEKGDIYTVRYDAVNAMLLNEFLKEHRKNEEQEATIARQQKQIEALTAGLQKVDAQLEMSRPAPQVAENN